MEFRLAFPFFSFQDLLILRIVNKEIKEAVEYCFDPTSKKSFVDKSRNIRNKGWVSDFKRHPPYIIGQEQQGKFRFVWDQGLPSVLPYKLWPIWLRVISPFVSKNVFHWITGISRYYLINQNGKPTSKIRAMLQVTKIGSLEDIVAIGVTTNPQKYSFVGMDESSFGYHLDDGLICQDSCITHRCPPSAKYDMVVLEIDYEMASWKIYQNEKLLYENKLYGEFLYNPLYIMVTGCIERICFFDLYVGF